MRCYFMRDGHITAVEMLSVDNDDGRITQARELFEAKGKQLGADGYE
jgi:hypothetical protein